MAKNHQSLTGPHKIGVVAPPTQRSVVDIIDDELSKFVREHVDSVERAANYVKDKEHTLDEIVQWLMKSVGPGSISIEGAHWGMALD